MIAIVHFSYALLQLFFAAWSVKIYQSNPKPAILILTGIALGLVYDNAIISIGAFLDIGTTLALLSIPRFVIHVLLTPLMLLTALYLAEQADLAWSKQKAVQGLVAFLAIALIGLGVWQSLLHMELVPACQDGLIRYTERLNETQLCADYPYAEGILEKRGLPPLAAIFTIIGVLGIGAAIWRKSGCAWLFAGAFVMFIAAAIPSSKFGLWIGNGGEVVLVASMLVSLAYFRQTLEHEGVKVA